VGFAHHLSEAWPERDLILIKHAVGGTSLVAWAPAWDSAQAELTRNASAGPLYATLLSQVRTTPLPEDAEFLGILWMQGERDANYPPVADKYLQNLENLVRSFRRDLGEPEVPFFLGQINPPSSGWPAAPVVREAQADAEAHIPRTVVIPTDDLTKREDEPVHYDTSGLLELGYRFSAAVVAYYSDSGRGGIRGRTSG
jgi:hypothetical protein